MYLPRWSLDLPGADLVNAGLADLAAGRISIEAALVSLVPTRLRSLGIYLPAPPIDNAPDRLYELVEDEVGEAAAHSRYNALRRRFASFMSVFGLANPQRQA